MPEVHLPHLDNEDRPASAPAESASVIPAPTPVPDNTIDSAGFDYSAWDVALATESLAYIDPELVALVSAAYRMQQVIEKDHDAIAQVSYQFTNQVHWFRGVLGYFGDTALHESLLLKRYDELLPRLEKAVADESVAPDGVDRSIDPASAARLASCPLAAASWSRCRVPRRRRPRSCCLSCSPVRSGQPA